MVISAHAYPWDVIGDPGFVERVQASGVDSVTLAASYHTTRAATPNHPKHKLVDMPHSSLLRAVKPGIWGRLAPLPFGNGDPFLEAATILHDAGIPITAWVVLAHNSRLGREHPHLTVLNCFGERYPYALCPSWTQVVDHCITLASEAIRDAPISGVSLESCGQMGLGHMGCHEKTDGAYTPLQQRLLSICCCDACGIPASSIRALFNAGLEPPASLLERRHAATDRLRAAVLQAVKSHAPNASVTLHAQADPWATGPSPGLTRTAAAEVDAILMPCWPLDSSIMPGAQAYVSTLAPFGSSVEALHDHVRRLREGGATGLALYHLGLKPDPAPLFSELGQTWRQS